MILFAQRAFLFLKHFEPPWLNGALAVGGAASDTGRLAVNLRTIVVPRRSAAPCPANYEEDSALTGQMVGERQEAAKGPA